MGERSDASYWIGRLMLLKIVWSLVTVKKTVFTVVMVALEVS